MRQSGTLYTFNVECKPFLGDLIADILLRVEMNRRPVEELWMQPLQQLSYAADALVLTHASDEQSAISQLGLEGLSRLAITSLFLEDDAVYIGPVHRLGLIGACGNCLRRRVSLYASVVDPVVHEAEANTLGAAVPQLAAALFQIHLLNNTSHHEIGVAWRLNLNSLRCERLWVPQNFECDVCSPVMAED